MELIHTRKAKGRKTRVLKWFRTLYLAQGFLLQGHQRPQTLTCLPGAEV